MSNGLEHAGSIGSLTDEQRRAAATGATNVFIEAGPGTGKTTVSAQRFGVQRFAPEHRHDHRAVVAVSFTRAATHHLRRRVQRLWGPRALTWPHRIITLDTVMSDLVHDLLRAGLIRWPSQTTVWPDGQIALEVHDSWAAFGGTDYIKDTYSLTVVGGQVTVRRVRAPERTSRLPLSEIMPRLHRGICTHQDVRDVLTHSLQDAACATHVRERLASTMRALIVDEVFDANGLDIAIIEAAINAGVAVTLIGDQWQALYVFRGARPEVVPQLIERTDIRTVHLTKSFRWRSDTQHALARQLRNGDRVQLPAEEVSDSPGNVDVVLALRWDSLWGLGGCVLPLAFHSFKGNGYEEAAATLLLNHVTRRIVGLDATYLNEALTALAITDHDVPRQLEPDMQNVLDILQPGGPAAVKAAYLKLVEVLSPPVSSRCLRRPHTAHTGRLSLIQQRLAFLGRPVPGLTTHQAKGGEWEVVGVRLTDTERAALGSGLSHTVDTHRQLYVACTRAHRLTTEVMPPPAAPARRSRPRRTS